MGQTIAPLPLRLHPGDDLRATLERIVREQALAAAFVLSGIGSLSAARVRTAGRREARAWNEDLEILSLAGTLSADGAHLHIAIADANGCVFGGHVEHGCRVRTTAEILIAPLPGHVFTRVADAATGDRELSIAAAPPAR